MASAVTAPDRAAIPGIPPACSLEVRDWLDDPEWDGFVAGAPGGHHVQTSRWARVKAVVGWHALRVLVRRDGRPVAGCQLLLRDLPAGGSIAYGPYGPLLAPGADDALEPLLEAMHDAGRAARVRYVKLQVPAGRPDLDRELSARGFAASDLPAALGATVQLDLATPADDLLRGTRRNIRRQVRKARTAGVTVREAGSDDLATITALIEASGRRAGFDPFPGAYYERIWREFAPDGHAVALIAEHAGRPLGVLLVVGWGESAVTKMSGTSGEGRDVFSDATLYWEAIRWAQARGFHLFDLEGIEIDVARAHLVGEELPPHGRTGATHVKLGFGGRVVVLPPGRDLAYGRITGPLVLAGVRRLERGRARDLANRLLGRG